MKLSIITILSPIILLLGIFAFCFSTNRTFIPMDIYLISHQLYEPGNAKKIHNSYMTDTLDVLLTWKYYLYQYQPQTCTTEVGGEKWGYSKSKGFLLPQGFCYPIGTVRPELFRDSLVLLSKVLPFFHAYNFSYVILLISIFLSAYIFFKIYSHGNPLASLIPAILAVTSFPVARELQHDGHILAAPFLFLSFATYLKGARENKKRFITLGFVFLCFAIFRSSLQALAIGFLLISLFALIWAPKGNRKTMGFTLLCFALSIVICILWNLPNLRVFLTQAQDFVPNREVSLFIALIKRAAAWTLSILHSLFGPIIFSFDTVDFYKSLGGLGARDYPSYDGSSVFLNSILSVLVFLFSFGAIQFKSTVNDNKIFKLIFISLVVDLLICVSPLYRIVYFRFHQWWLLLCFLMLVSYWLSAERDLVINKKRLINIIKIAVGVFLLAFSIVFYFKGFLLERLSNQGVLGFEAGLWEFRVEKWLRRIIFTDAFSLAWLGFAVAGVWMYLKRRWNYLAWAVAISGFFLTTFHFNLPQKIITFDKYRASLENNPWKLEGPARPLHENNMLLLNKPVWHVYESLSIHMPTEKKNEK